MKSHSLQDYTAVLSSISSPFISSSIDDTDAVVAQVLQTVLESTEVQRAYIFLLSDDGQHLTLSYEICAEDILPHKGILESVAVADLPEFIAELKSGNDIFQTISEIPKSEETESVRSIMDRLSIASFINIPMFFGSELVGYIGFDSVHEEADWPDEVRYVFRFAGNTIASALFRKEQHKTIARMYAQQKAMLDNAPYNAWLTDVSGRYVAVNRHFLSMLGKNSSEVLGKRPSDVLPENLAREIEKTRLEILNTGQRQIREVQLSEDPETWHQVFRSPVVRMDGAVEGIAGVSVDITQLKKTQQYLSGLNEAKNTLFATIGHDMRSPLTTLKSLTHMLVDHEDALQADERNELYRSVNRQLDNTLTILDNLFQWAQLQRKGIVLRKAETTTESLLQEVYGNIRHHLNDKRIQLYFTGDGAYAVFVDRNMVLSALRNILTNAIKFTPEGGRITVNVGSDGATVAITVTDTGVGIQQDALPKLLQPHNRVSTRGTNNETGSGLGLVLTKSFIEQNGGTLRIESTLGQGTQVTVELPIQAQ